MAVLFGKEGFESGNKGDFDSEETWGGGSVSYDSGSKIDGTYTLKSSMTGEGEAALLENLGSDYETLYIQFKLHMPSGWDFGSGTYYSILSCLDSSDNERFTVTVEDWGSAPWELTYGGDPGWTDTGETIPVNATTKIEVMITKKASGGRVKVWINNDTEGSPDYDSGSINTGDIDIRKILAGVNYADDSHDPVYFDSITISDSFIGAGSTNVTVNPSVQTATLSIPSITVWTETAATYIYNSAKKHQLNGNLDLDTNSIKVALVDTDYSFDQDNHEYWDDVSGSEISGSGYTAGGAALSSKAVTQDNTDNEGVFDAADVTWSSATISSFRGAIIYKDTGTPSTSPLIAYIDFDGNYSASAEDVKIQWNTEGIINLS